VCVDPAYTRSTSPSTLLPTSDAAAAVCTVSLFVIFLFFFSFIFLGAKIFRLLFGCLLFDLEMNRKMKKKKWLAASRET
jgi:hypothetical protein